MSEQETEMPDPQFSTMYVALGTSQKPLLLVDDDRDKLVAAVEAFQPQSQDIRIFDTDGFSFGPAGQLATTQAVQPQRPAQVPDEDTKRFYAEVAAVLAAMASQAASIASGERELLVRREEPLFESPECKCSCFWCFLGKCC